MSNSKLIVLSFDALQSGDLDKLFKMPYFSKIKEKAAVVKNVKEIYPTLTYPIHTTIATGVYPQTHGISHNKQSAIQSDDPGWSIMGSDWNWEKKNIKVPTLMDAAFESGKTVATVLWPVTAGEKRGYNLPEIWPSKGDEKVNPKALFERTSSENVFNEYYDEYIASYDWNNNEDMVFYSMDIAIDILKKHKPDLLMVHVIHMDHVRHLFGDQGFAVDLCLRELDIIAGRFIQAAEDAGVLNDTNFVILGDHGQIDIKSIFNLNVLFQEHGLIQTDGKGNVLDYAAYNFSAGFSTQIMLKEPNKEMLDTVAKILEEIKERYPHYIERIYTAEEVQQEESLSGEFSFVIEGTEGTLFLNDVDTDLIIPKDSPKYKEYAATHGHHPLKGEKPPFVAFGPKVKLNTTIEHGNMIDVCPTLAQLIGIDFKQAEGKPFPIFK